MPRENIQCYDDQIFTQGCPVSCRGGHFGPRDRRAELRVSGGGHVAWELVCAWCWEQVVKELLDLPAIMCQAVGRRTTHIAAIGNAQCRN